MNNKLVYILIFCLLSSLANAQDTLYRYTYGGMKNDEGKSLIQTFDKHYILAGQSSSYGLVNSNIYIYKIDTLGNVIWRKDYGGYNLEDCNNIISLSDSNALISGFTNSFGNGGYDAYAIKINTNTGDTIWTKTYGGSDWDFFEKAIEMPDSNLVFCGKTYSSTKGLSDAYIVKTTALGDTIWTTTIGTDSIDYAKGLVLDNDSNIIVLCNTEINNKPEILLYKLDKTTGDTMWSKFYQENKPIYGNDMLLTSDNNLLITGVVDSSNNNSKDMLLAKLNMQGNFIWSHFYGGPNDEEAYAVVENFNQQFVVAGYTKSYGQGGRDLHVYYVDFAGWVITGPGSGGVYDEQANDVIVNDKNEFVFLGTTNTFGNGLTDFYFIKSDTFCVLDNVVLGGIIIGRNEVVNQTNNDVVIYPIPTKNVINIRVNNNTNNTLTFYLYTTTGVEVINEELNNSKKINLSKLLKGIYIYQVKDNNRIIQSGKLIKN